jgi:hypothetical protein
MAMLYTFRMPSLFRHVHRELLRSVLPDLTLIISATAYHQRNYVERYSKFSHAHNQPRPEVLWRGVWPGPRGNWVGWAAGEVLWMEPLSVGLPPNGA